MWGKVSQFAARLTHADDAGMANELERLRLEVDELRDQNTELELARQQTVDHARLEIKAYKEAISRLDKQLKVLQDLSSIEWGTEQLELERRKLEIEQEHLEAIRRTALEDLTKAEYLRLHLEMEAGTKQ